MRCMCPINLVTPRRQAGQGVLPFFTDKETEAQTGGILCSRLQMMEKVSGPWFVTSIGCVNEGGREEAGGF